MAFTFTVGAATVTMRPVGGRRTTKYHTTTAMCDSVGRRLSHLEAKAAAMLRTNKSMATDCGTLRHAEQCKRQFVCDVLHPEAQAAIAEEPGAQTDGASLVQATLNVHARESRGDGASSALRASHDLHRANQLALLNSLADQLRRLSDRYSVESGTTLMAGSSTSVSMTHEGARRGL